MDTGGKAVGVKSKKNPKNILFCSENFIGIFYTEYIKWLANMNLGIGGKHNENEYETMD